MKLWVKALLFVLVLILVVGELWPKTYGAMRSEPAARVVAGPMVWLTRALSPIVVVMTAISNAVLRVFGVKTRSSRHFITSDEIRAAADIGEEEGVVDPEEGRMLDKVIDLGERTVRDIMVPRVDIVAAPEDTQIEDLVELAVKVAVTRVESILAGTDFRPQAQVPLAYLGAIVASIAEHRGQGGVARGQRQRASQRNRTQDPVPAGRPSHQHRGPCR